MTMDWSKLIAEARAATPGPWEMRDGYGPSPTDGKCGVKRIANSDHETVVDASGGMSVVATFETFNHIARYDPATVELMLTALQRAEPALIGSLDHPYQACENVVHADGSKTAVPGSDHRCFVCEAIEALVQAKVALSD